MLRRVVPDDGVMARLGGDEFVLAVSGAEVADHGGSLARRVNAAMSDPFDFGDWSATLSCSIGIADWAPGMPPSELLRHADQAMYRAKAQGWGGHAHYDEALGEALRERAALEQDLHRALAEGRVIMPYFQPIYDITGWSLRFFEVLARWNDPVRGFVPPDHFIPMAEEIGLIDPLSELVLDRACAALATWPTDLPISFNLSPGSSATWAFRGASSRSSRGTGFRARGWKSRSRRGQCLPISTSRAPSCGSLRRRG